MSATFIPLRDVLARLPGYRPGSAKHRSTLIRYATTGVTGPAGEVIRLRAIKLGRQWLTTDEWADEFFAALVPGAAPPVQPAAAGPARKRAVQAAAARLEAAGA